MFTAPSSTNPGTAHVGRITRRTDTGYSVTLPLIGAEYEFPVVAWPITATLNPDVEVVIVFRADGEAVVVAELTSDLPPA